MDVESILTIGKERTENERQREYKQMGDHIHHEIVQSSCTTFIQSFHFKEVKYKTNRQTHLESSAAYE